MSEPQYIEEAVTFPSGAETLEGVLAYPEAESPRMAILLLSPHPHMGGRMNNNVIEHLARRFAGAGCATLRFNYRGVGRSTLAMPESATVYEYWARLEDRKDYRAALPDSIAALDYLAGALPPETPVGYIGYSFGCCLATLLAGTHPPARLAAISPPVNRARLEGLGQLAMPVRFVAGDRDFVFDPALLRAPFAGIPGPKSYVELDGCDHFFRKQEERVYQAIRTLFLGGGDGTF